MPQCPSTARRDAPCSHSTYPCQPGLPLEANKVGKSAASDDNQSTNSLSLRERAGVRVKCLDTHQPPAETPLVATPPTPVSPVSLWKLTRVGKSAASDDNQSTNSLSLRERAGVRVKCLDTQSTIRRYVPCSCPACPYEPSLILCYNNLTNRTKERSYHNLTDMQIPNYPLSLRADKGRQKRSQL